ncbi:DNA polymerase III subunit gamma/tau [Parvibaculum sp.]|uniref:DNA polymerase III subunit gamma/tau n=1 Tax=Parvibaculum sp. TaxID=2024848 RepID=UPI0027306C5A|nr:DNA polymerase III subunit gamma/tau [Parvibaculum sp.]MDP1626339.1 DNA polymerase III subunit gamma/tau [Parvibaculum sp.]MDP2151270.1 DNA polymerase III subunit gamma/tau [Parvibaculum sp.]MDP3327111.1 DNA polymerase III subunit gamma/tau [Parvibaculum sp.]
MNDSVENLATEEDAPHRPDPATEPGFNLGDVPPAPTRAVSSGYQVLARKYRPTVFADLVGQEAMVRTLSNAFDADRVAHAFMLTGVRGVGKTTTARILARALNYEKPGATKGDGSGPTIHMDGLGVHCEAIMESRHVDVMEMDAASRTGIDDIREIIDSVRYLPVSARYKVYIIDEVHMLSKQAFNGLLKTLEEPPAHVKFIFATTEIRKVPVTVLSRCQRFDLRRLSVDELTGLLGSVATKEHVEAEDAALRLVARAADGSARDALSLLDRAISHGENGVLESDVRDMLGLADRARVFDLFDLLMKGDIGGALTELRAQYDVGADPAVVLSDLAELTHWLTRLKLVEGASDDVAMSETERTRGRDMAERLPIRVLSRVWQMLLKGLTEVQGAARPIAAAEMVLVRLAYVADGPGPEELLEQLKGGGAAPARSTAQSAAPSSDGPRAQLRSVSTIATDFRPAESTPAAAVATAAIVRNFEDVVALVSKQRDIRLKHALEAGVRLVSFEPGRIEISLLEGTQSTIVSELSDTLSKATGTRWFVSIARGPAPATPTLREQAQTREEAAKENARADPLVKAALAAFPGAEIVDVREPGLVLPEGEGLLPPDPEAAFENMESDE